MKFFVILAILIPGFASASVVINEIAWMGSSPKAGESATVASNNEWIELYNAGSELSDLKGWTLAAADGQPSIALSGTISAGGYFLLERSDDESVPGIAADLIYTGALGNGGEKFELRNASGIIIDSVDATAGWPAGDNTTKETMQMTSSGAWITAVATPRAKNASAMNQESVSTQQAETQTNSTGQTGSPTIQEQKLFFMVDAGKDITTVAGAEVRFQGAAFNFDGKPLDETSGLIRYLWNFGDGSFFEGKNTNHIYRYPGAYRAALYVSSGQTSGSDVIEITVEESNVNISEISSAWIELVNHGSLAVDMSSWQIRSDSTIFTIPVHTIVGPRAFVVFSQETTGLLFGSFNPKAELRYANGTLADSLSFAGVLLSGKSVIRNEEGKGVMGEMTPGRENKMYNVGGSMYQGKDVFSVIASDRKERSNPVGYSEIASSVLPPRVDEQSDNQALVSEAINPPNLPLYKGRNGGVTDSNYFWLAVSISIGLIAGVVVLALRAMVLF